MTEVQPAQLAFILVCLGVCAAAAFLLIRNYQQNLKKEEEQRAFMERLEKTLSEKAQSDEKQQADRQAAMDDALQAVSDTLSQLSSDIQRTQQGQLDALGGQLRAADAAMDARVEAMNGKLEAVDSRLAHTEETQDERFSALQTQLNLGISRIGTAQQEALMRIETSVAEKIEGVLDRRLDPSLNAVTGRLDEITDGLREISRIAETGNAGFQGLQSLPGLSGSAELGTILAQMLAPSQYAAHARVRPDGAEVADYVVMMPGQGDGRTVMLPVDSGLPLREYEELCKVTESGNAEEIAHARGLLESSVRMHARRMSEKLIAPPYTTDYAVLFLPGEGLYAEVLRISGLTECIQRESHMVIAGPTTFSALVSSLQIGFRSLAIEQQTEQIEKLLGVVRREVDRYSVALGRTQNRLRQAAQEIETVQKHGDTLRRRLTDLPSIRDESGRREIPEETDGLNSTEDGDEWD